ncbi:MAG: hypothetical protein RL095_2006 [Verrucomicrobiota bacterium]
MSGDDSSFSFEISPELVAQFMVEALEQLQEAEATLLKLMQSPDDAAALQLVMQYIHTFKGNCGLLALSQLQQASHAVESLIIAVQDGEVESAPAVAASLETIDSLREGLNNFAQGGPGEVPDLDQVLAHLKKIQGISAPEAQDRKQQEAADSGEMVRAFMEASEQLRQESQRISSRALELTESIRLLMDSLPCDAASQVFQALSAALSACQDDASRQSFRPVIVGFCDKLDNFAFALLDGVAAWPDPAPDIDEISCLINKAAERQPQAAALAAPLAGIASAPAAEIRSEASAPAPQKPAAPAKETQSKAETRSESPAEVKPEAAAKARREIRVDVDKLDRLMNLVGELLISEIMVTHNPDLAGLNLPNFERASHRLRLITNELQDLAMAVRLVPISGVFRRMSRVIHDLKQRSGKEIRLELKGEDTEVDRSVIEILGDPLMHMLRNSADHGLETPEERRAAGKPEEGCIRLSAAQIGAEIVITLQDDGRGLSRSRILAKARQQALIEDEGTSMSDQDVWQLIFKPGFSTADTVTDISGRGVGMDVVRSNIDKVKGRIEIHSEAGKGASFVIRIPLSLSTIDGMLVKVGHVQYMIPLLLIRETLRPHPEQLNTRHDGQEFLRIRKEVLPVVRLHLCHGIEPRTQRLDEGIVIIINLFRGPICLFVDDIVSQMQTIVKPLAGQICNTPGISGFTILSDGQVALILDLEEVMQLTHKS